MGREIFSVAVREKILKKLGLLLVDDF